MDTINVKNSTAGFPETRETWKIDWDGVSEAQIKSLAMRAVKIYFQQKWRDATVSANKAMDWDGKTMAVKDIFANARTRKTPEEKAREAIEALRKAGMADADIAAMLKG